MASSELSIKLLLDSSCNKVLFAEAGKDFVDFLFYIMSLPVGSLISLLRKHGKVGCLTNLYESIENLNESYMQPNQQKDVLLKPRPVVPATKFPLLLSNSPSTDLQYLYYSSNCRCVTDVSGTTCNCGYSMINRCRFFGGNSAAASSTRDGGFVKGVVTYMVMDDLTVQPLSSISSITLLNKLNVKDVGRLQEKVINFGMDEAIKLLRASLHSQTVLTDVFA